MATDDDRRTEPTTAQTGRMVPRDEDSLRDLAMREVLGLLEDDEAAGFEEAFVAMTPDDQAAVLDLQAAVAREIAAGGIDEPDRALRYKVLAKLTEEMSGDIAASGPIAVIGGTADPGRRRPLQAARGRDELGVTQLQFDRVRRSAAVWRAASFALCAATIAFFGLHYQGQANMNQLLGTRANEVVAERFSGLFGDDVDIRSFFEDSTAVASPLASTRSGDPGAGLLLRRGKLNDAGLMPAALLCLQLPQATTEVEVFAVPIDGSSAIALGQFPVTSTTAAALPLELGGIDLANIRLEVRDAGSGTVLLRTAAVA